MNFSNKQILNPVYFVFPLIVGLIFQLIPLIGWNLEFMPGDLGDTRFNIFVLEHGHQFITGQVDSFWSAGFMHPEPEVISLSDNLLGTMPLYALFRVLGADIFSAFQYWLILLTLLNYLCSFKLIQFITNNAAASGLGAFVFTFSIGLAAQMNHAQMYPRFALPLLIYFLLLWLKDLRPKHFVFSVSLLVYLFYCGIYLGFMGAIPFVALFFYIAYKHKTTLLSQLKERKKLILYSTGIVLNLLALLTLFLPYLRRAKTSELHHYRDIVASIPTPKSYLSAFPGTPVHGILENTTNHYPAFWDHWMFPGWIALFGLVFLFWTFIRKSETFHNTQALSALALSGFITLIFFLRIDGYSLYYFLHKLPGFGAMRSMTRIINIELLFMGIGVALLFCFLAKKIRVHSLAVFMGFVFLLFADNYLPGERSLHMTKAEMLDRHESICAKFEGIPKGLVVSYEPEEIVGDVAHVQIDVMLAAQSLGLKSVNGYSGSAALNFWMFWMEPNENSRVFYFERFAPEEIGEVVVVK
jgi:hypothetical protein